MQAIAEGVKQRAQTKGADGDGNELDATGQLGRPERKRPLSGLRIDVNGAKSKSDQGRNDARFPVDPIVAKSVGIPIMADRKFSAGPKLRDT